jgi:hypothetical protein
MSYGICVGQVHDYCSFGLEENMPIESDDYENYQRYTGEHEAEKIRATLEGIITGMLIDNELSTIEIEKLKAWCADNYGYIDIPSYSELLHIIFNKNDVAIKIDDFINIYKTITTDNKRFNDITISIQKLHGILHGILLDGIISTEELNGLLVWMNSNLNMKGTYPYDEIYSLVYENINHNEGQNLLKVYFSQFINISYTAIDKSDIEKLRQSTPIPLICAREPHIEFKNKEFCFTGISSQDKKRNEIIDIIGNVGGRYNNNVTNSTDYLIIGDKNNPSWAYVTYGRKTEKAIELRKYGHITLVKETDFWNTINAHQNNQENTHGEKDISYSLEKSHNNTSKRNAKISIYELIDKIHDDIKGLIWYGDGKLKNYQNVKEAEKIKAVAGPFTVTLSVTDDNDTEPSLILISEPIIEPVMGEHIGSLKGKRLAYLDLTAKKRWKYFQYLQNPYQLTDIEYMLILYYGLERHLVYGDFNSAFNAIQKLREIYLDDRFQRDSLSALAFSSILRSKINDTRDYFEKMSAQHRIDMYFEYLLYCYYHFNIPLTPYYIMKIARGFGYNKVYIEKYPETFGKNIESILIKKYNDDKLHIHQFVNEDDIRLLSRKRMYIVENVSLRGIEYEYYNISEIENFRNIITEIINTSHEITKKEIGDSQRKNKQ